jgi:hypothetical protein
MTESDKIKILELETRIRELEAELNGLADKVEIKPKVKIKEKR